MSSNKNPPTYKNLTLLNFYDYSKIKGTPPIQAEKKRNKRNTAAASYADKLHSNSGQVTAVKKAKITATVTSASTPDNGHTPKTTDVQTLTAAKRGKITATVTSASTPDNNRQGHTAKTTDVHTLTAVGEEDTEDTTAIPAASNNENNNEISLIEVAEEISTSEDGIENEGCDCENGNCKKKVASQYYYIYRPKITICTTAKMF